MKLQHWGLYQRFPQCLETAFVVLVPAPRQVLLKEFSYLRPFSKDHWVDPRQCHLAVFAVRPLFLPLLSGLDAWRPDSLGTSSTMEGALLNFPSLDRPWDYPLTHGTQDACNYGCLPPSLPSMAAMSAEYDRRHRGQGCLALPCLYRVWQCERGEGHT